jgi:hypothetical protein
MAFFEICSRYTVTSTQSGRTTRTSASMAGSPPCAAHGVVNGARILQLWLGGDGRGRLKASGIYQVITRRGEQTGWQCTRTGSGIISATSGSTPPARRGT